jgi:hypothetical protein
VRQKNRARCSSNTHVDGHLENFGTIEEHAHVFAVNKMMDEHGRE